MQKDKVDITNSLFFANKKSICANECGANIYRCFKYKLKFYLIETLH